MCRVLSLRSFFFEDTATSAIYTLSLHDALPISRQDDEALRFRGRDTATLEVIQLVVVDRPHRAGVRSEEHTSELQSRGHLVCRLLLEKKKKKPRREQTI